MVPERRLTADEVLHELERAGVEIAPPEEHDEDERWTFYVSLPGDETGDSDA